MQTRPEADPIVVWYVWTRDVVDQGLLGACERVMPPYEREREHKFAFARHRHEYIVTRALCRGVLGQRLGVDPGSLVFEWDVHGRPDLVPARDIRFNLTNTVELVACGISSGGDLGVDAERVSRADAILGVASTVFTEAERASLLSLETEERRTRAVRLWTGKEAYVKARGLGFELDPQSFELDFHGDQIAVRFLDDENDLPEYWTILTQEVEGHVIATCSSRAVADTGVIVREAHLSELLPHGLPVVADGPRRTR
jgi:4'-phosphopantetheinyl transferase